MININFSFSLSDLPFYIIPKIIPFKRNKIKGVMVRWLTFQFIVDNSRMCRVEVESCLQLGYTLLFDSFSKSSELINIIDDTSKEIISLKIFSKFSFKEIGEILNISYFKVILKYNRSTTLIKRKNK